MDKKIVSTFMFSEPHEQELLWLKFNVEDSFVSEWVIIEGAFTFQGKRKEKYLQDILSQPRFYKYLNKIKYIEHDYNCNFDYEPGFLTFFKRKLKKWLNETLNKNFEKVPYAELASFHAEINQRGASLSYLRGKYSEEDIVILCDTDEIFDFNGVKWQEISRIINENSTPFYIPREIYCYDFNNKTNRARFSPIVKLGDLKDLKSFHEVRHPQPSRRRIVAPKYMLAYEYTFCFSKEAILKKLTSFAHVSDLDEHAVNFCLENNISFINHNKIDLLYKKNKENFYTLIDNDKLDGPTYLKTNYMDFKTGVVNLNYINIRKANNIEQFNN